MPIMEIDARAIERPEGGAACRVCGTPIRSEGRGQRPDYCGRSCSSKAYRHRVKERQKAALAAAADGSRESSNRFDDDAVQRLAQLGAVVERTAHRLADDLDKGTDPMPLRISLAALERAAESMLARARTAVRTAGAQQGARSDAQADASREPLAGEAGLLAQRAHRGMDALRASPVGNDRVDR